MCFVLIINDRNIAHSANNNLCPSLKLFGTTWYIEVTY